MYKLRLRMIRTDRHLKQKELAAYLGCNMSAYSKYERGEREIPLRFLDMLAVYYGTSIDYLLGRTDMIHPYPPAR